MKHAWTMAAALVLFACGPKPPPEPSAGLGRCEAGLSHKVCKCAFEAMPTERWQAFAAWAEKHKGVSDAAVWNNASLHAAMAATTNNPAETEAAARELVFLKATCGAPVTQHAILRSARLSSAG
jgi:hypothetical protein